MVLEAVVELMLMVNSEVHLHIVLDFSYKQENCPVFPPFFPSAESFIQVNRQ